MPLPLYYVKLLCACVRVRVRVCVPGGSVSGAVFNPSLAFSTQFPCSGNSFLEYSLVYWAGPLLGNQANATVKAKLMFIYS